MSRSSLWGICALMLGCHWVSGCASLSSSKRKRREESRLSQVLRICIILRLRFVKRGRARPGWGWRLGLQSKKVVLMWIRHTTLVERRLAHLARLRRVTTQDRVVSVILAPLRRNGRCGLCLGLDD